MNKLIIAIIVIAPCGCSNFSTQDTILQSISQGMLVADWSQTLDIKNHPSLHEINPILGNHPSNSAVNGYFAASVAANQCVANMLDGSARTYFQTGVIILESLAVSNNHALGIRLSF